jgi:hypothetical protein
MHMHTSAAQAAHTTDTQTAYRHHRHCRLDLTTQQQEHVGRHADGVKCTEWLDAKGEHLRCC